MKNLERYVFGSFLSSFFLAFLVLSFVLTIGLMVQIVSYMLQGVPSDLVGRFALVSFPETMQWTVPLALLVSSILVFSRLSADSEIAAMRSCGVNLLTVMRWPLAFALLCTFVCLFVNNEIVPRGHEVRRSLKNRLAVGTGLELLEPGRTINDFPDVQLYFEARDKEAGSLKNLTIVDRRDPKCTRTLTAKEAFVRQDGRDIVLDVKELTVDPVDLEHPQPMHAETFRWRVDDVLKEGTYKRREKDYRFAEMLAAIDVRKKEVREARDVSKAGADGGAKDAKSRLKSARRSLSDIRTEFMKRWVFAFASICFVLVGVPLGIRAQRKESSVGMGIALVTALFYYLVVILMTSLSKNYHVHPEVLIWLPVVVCIAVSSFLIPKNL
ncbi:MAG: LptF/LptG family permease [Kiritimatiellae bacterium]|nr:LptF/LptG family permease [Kiritimatiellia bacterium]